MSHDEAQVRADIARTLTPLTPRVYESLGVALSRFEDYPSLAPGETLPADSETYLVRVLAKRNAGKIVFTQLVDVKSSDMIQGLVAPQGIDLDKIQEFKSTVHIGDVLSVTGTLTLSNTGERTVLISDYAIASKCVAPFPKMAKTAEGGLGLALQAETIHNDPTLRLLVDPEHRARVVARAQMTQTIRRIWSVDHLEVETPILSHTVGGASAARFTTHAQATGNDLNLRVATELYLKRLVIGGVGNVFEIGKNFRNEGIDKTHSPEFTSLEGYAIGEDYMEQLERVFRLFNTLFEDFWAFTYLDFFTAISDALGIAVTPQTSADCVITAARERGFEVVDGASVEDVFDLVVVPFFENKYTVVMDYPRASTPLAADHPTIPGVCQKWDLYVGSMEVATGYTENLDSEQIEMLMPEDGAFIRDMKYGLPPLGGVGIGIDRLAMLVCGVDNIHDTLHTPHSAA